MTEKKAVPTLAELRKAKAENSSTVDNDGTVEVDANKDHVHTWEENPEHNLAKLHPDSVPTSPVSDQTGVTETTTTTVYAPESENDDKGFAEKVERLNKDSDEEVK